jgi:hypothetical protein
VAINAYNHHIGGVDIANQYRAAFTTLRPQNLRYWKPLFYWLLDIALVNSYLLSRAYSGSIGDSRDHRDHRKFLEALADALMSYCEGPEHSRTYRASRAYCAYCREHQLNWQPTHLQPPPRPRAFGADITNTYRASRGRFWGSRTQWGCD